ncbi:polymorphic toxin-type HINT domain-containing protein, partial [Roseateles terrae]
AGTLAQGWDGQKLAQQAKVNAQIVAEFGAQAANEVARNLDEKAKELRAAGKVEEAKKYEEGGEYRVAAHAVVGAMTGGVAGALGGAASASVADKLNDLQRVLTKSLTDAGLGPDKDGNNDWASGLARLASGALATGVGFAAGGSFDAAAAGLNQDFNNRQLHTNERQLIADLAEKRAKEFCGTNATCDAAVYGAYLADAMQRLAEAAVDSDKAKETATYFAELKAIAAKNPSSVAALGGLDAYDAMLTEARRLLSPYVGKVITVRGIAATADGSVQTYFKATDAQKNDHTANAFLGQLPTSSVVPGMNLRDEMRVEGLTAQLGSALPDTTLEEIFLGGAIEKRLGKLVGEWWKTLPGKGGLTGVIDSDVSVIAKQIGDLELPSSSFSKPSSSSGKCSFRGDMLVQTSNGFSRIDDIKLGDWVLSRDERTNALANKRVLAQYSNPYRETVYLGIINSSGSTQTIVTNRIHPFFVKLPIGRNAPPSSEGHNYLGPIPGGAWIDAQNLTVGLVLIGPDGKDQLVDSVQIRTEELRAFNLTVEDFHTYFIKAPDGEEAIWVHNNCFDYLPASAQPTGKTTPDGRKLYTFRDQDGSQITVYEGIDGRYYDSKKFPPDAALPPNVKSSNLEEVKRIPELDEFTRVVNGGGLSPSEKLAYKMAVLRDVAESNGWTVDRDLTRMNRRTVYQDPGEPGVFWSQDTQHGTFEKHDRFGNHLGEYDIKLSPTKDPQGHKLKVK